MLGVASLSKAVGYQILEYYFIKCHIYNDLWINFS